MGADKGFIISVGVLLLAFIAIQGLDRRRPPEVVATNLEKIPLRIDGYRGTEDSFPEAVYRVLNADRHVYRHYLAPGGETVDLYIGYYGTAKGGRTPHNPYACYPGAGWTILDTERVPLVTETHPEGCTVNYMLARKGEVYETVFHWYQSGGDRVMSTGIEQNLQRFFGRLLHNRNDGAFVRVTVNSAEGGLEDARKLAMAFSAKVVDHLPVYWPEER